MARAEAGAAAVVKVAGMAVVGKAVEAVRATAEVEEAVTGMVGAGEVWAGAAGACTPHSSRTKSNGNKTYRHSVRRSTRGRRGHLRQGNQARAGDALAETWETV